jgi:hypothetical protein
VWPDLHVLVVEDDVTIYRGNGARTLQAWHPTKNGSITLLLDYAERIYGSECHRAAS